MQDELRKAWDKRAPDLPLASSYEALILASIVEKETALERERAADRRRVRRRGCGAACACRPIRP